MPRIRLANERPFANYRSLLTADDVQISIDCAEPHVLAEWWAKALGVGGGADR